MTPERWVALSIMALLSFGFALMARVQDRWQLEKKKRDIKIGDIMFCSRKGGALHSMPVRFIKRKNGEFIYATGIILNNVEAQFTANEIVAVVPKTQPAQIPAIKSSA